jgi:Tfp pilus assembly protein PilX
MKKSVVMIVVMAVIVILSILAITALTLMTQESRLAENKIRHMRAYYAAQAGSVYALEEFRKYNNSTGPSGNLSAITIGAGLDGYPSAGYTPVITRTPGAIGGTDEVNVTVSY